MKLGVTGSVYKKQPLGKTATPTLMGTSVIKDSPYHPGEAIGVAEIKNNDVESVSLYCDGVEMPLPVAPGAITERVLVTKPLTSNDYVIVRISAKAGDREMSNQINVAFHFGISVG